MLDGIFIGATRTRDMRNMMAVSFAGYVRAGAAVGAGLGQPRALGGADGIFSLRGLTLGLALPGAGTRGELRTDFSYE
jgi:MATE family multidrug resistance protein